MFFHERFSKPDDADRRRGRMRSRSVCFLIVSFLSWEFGVAARAQEQGPVRPGEIATSQQTQELPEAPVSGTEFISSATGSARVSGTVVDSSGAAVSGAKVSLKDAHGAQQDTMTTGPDGGFAFSRISPGSYVITVSAEGFQESTSAKFMLTAQQNYEIPSIVLPIAAATTEVVVRPTEVIAEEQMKAEERQRVFGIVPNFYTS
jgi:hypothetical protein